MDELVKRISEKTGISEDQARSAVNVVSNFLKEKLPAPIAGQVDNVLSGAGGMTDKLGDAAAKVGNIFGGSWTQLHHRQAMGFALTIPFGIDDS